MTGGTPPKSRASNIGMFALIGGLVGLAQYVTEPHLDAYRGGIPELIGTVGGAAIVGGLVGWIVYRIATRKTRRPS